MEPFLDFIPSTKKKNLLAKPYLLLWEYAKQESKLQICQR